MVGRRDGIITLRIFLQILNERVVHFRMTQGIYGLNLEGKRQTPFVG